MTFEVERVAYVKPRTKKQTSDLHRRNRIFRAFRNVYRQLYGMEPDSYTIRDDGFMIVKKGDQILEVASEQRIQQVTRMFRDRLNARGLA
jgi:hypothetical protein